MSYRINNPKYRRSCPAKYNLGKPGIEKIRLNSSGITVIRGVRCRLLDRLHAIVFGRFYGHKGGVTFGAEYRRTERKLGGQIDVAA
jgi:hypothetical protein